MSRRAPSATALAAISLCIVAACQGEAENAGAERAEAAPTGAATQDQDPPRGSAEWKIQNAMSAAPEELARNATIMDWPDTEGGDMRELRAGTNSWTCMPSTPNVVEMPAVEDPMCLDERWMAWLGAWVGRDAPRIQSVGLGYMLRGDGGASNTDPFATGPMPDNEWVQAGPHLMLIVPDVRQLEGIPTDPANGGPWVMWSGTPYAHVMVPVPGGH